MCLYTKNREPFLAKEDIVCYKVLIKTKIPCVYKTPVTRTRFTKFPLIKKNFKAEGDRRVVEIPLSVGVCFEISVGFIHTYKDIEYTKHCVNYSLCRDNYVIFKCIIPKGTYYYESETEYASERIEILDKVKVDFLSDLKIYL